MSRPERGDVLSLLHRISASPLGERLILAGSSGVYGASETIPALTEDVDVLIDADWVGAHQGELLEEMRRLGFEHQPGTCTFLGPAGLSLDLVGYSRLDTVDRVGGSREVPVMVYSDLSRLLSADGSVIGLASGGRALSPAALVASKLLTIRLEKGGKDKLQALLLIEERSQDEGFLSSLRDLLAAFEPDRLEDALSDAQAASLAVSSDAVRAEPQASGYVEMSAAVRRGLEILQDLAGRKRGEP